MIHVQQAAFSFETFTVPKLSYNAENSDGNEFSIGFDPSGLYSLATGEFRLQLNIAIRDKAEASKLVFDLTAFAYFKFEPIVPIQELPAYFFKNAIAIMFPYVRAFISTITLQANIKHLNLHLMNLSELEEPLRMNTHVVEVDSSMQI